MTTEYRRSCGACRRAIPLPPTFQEDTSQVRRCVVMDKSVTAEDTACSEFSQTAPANTTQGQAKQRN
jgi:hypothetical protein